MSNAAKVVSPLALIGSVIAAVLAPKGSTGVEVARIAAVITAALTGAVHSPTVKKLLQKTTVTRKRNKGKGGIVKKHPELMRVFDSVSVNALTRIVSSAAEGVVGYNNGLFNNIAAVKRAFPNHLHASVSVTAALPGNWLDIENGDANEEQAPGWYRKFRKQGARGFYISLSRLPKLREVMRAAGFADSSYEVWVADWVGFLFNVKGAAGTQCINDPAADYDESLVITEKFFGVK